ncbi:thioesterase II family protein [Streptomyces sp. NPDC058682]|uniref:thioesterase II family protein n=1 Tax=Streptomyces sp. NPDC058682 TaxID=3346596 RepID=UPI003667F12C
MGEMLDDPDKRNALMPIIRADRKMFEDYAGQNHEPIDCDVVAVCGTEDPQASHNDTEAWRDFTQRTASVHQTTQ